MLAQWHMPLIPALRSQRQADLYELKANLVYMGDLAQGSQKNKTKQKTTLQHISPV